MVQKEMRFQPPARSYLTGVRGRDVGRRRGLQHKERHGRRAHRTMKSRTKFFKITASQDKTPLNAVFARPRFGIPHHLYIHG
jgi:hypothetical protein